MSKTPEPYTLTAIEALQQIEEGNLTSRDWFQSCLARIDAREPEVHAWAYLNKDALSEVEAREKQGLSPSVPVGAKDIIDVIGQPTMMGAHFHDPAPKTREGGSVSVMREAGCVFVGKAVSTELGHRAPGPTRNPHNLNHTPGGSSSGSAAAVADFMVPLCLGTQTSGSVIRPASYCGVIGYKPTYNDFDKTGILPNGPSMDTLGIMARSIQDVALLRGILLEEPMVPVEAPDLSDIRVGFIRATPWETADSEMQNCIGQLEAELAAKGAKLVEIQLDKEIARLIELHRIISGYEFRRSIAFERIHHFEHLSAVLREGRLADGHDVNNREYQAGILELAKLRLKVQAAFETVDVMILPSAPGAALPTLESTGTASFNAAWALTGDPAISLPLYQSTDTGLPIGVQVVGAFANDDRLLAVSEALMRLKQT